MKTRHINFCFVCIGLLMAIIIAAITPSADAQFDVDGMRTNAAWLNASQLAVGYVPNPRIATNDSAGSTTNGMVLSRSGNRMQWVPPPASGGSVSSVAMTVPSILAVSGSPVTGSGTLAVTLATETANTVLAGPTSGGAATPTFRVFTLASADFVNQGTTTTLLHGNASGNPSFGAVLEADQNLTDLTTENVSTSRHGYVPKLPNDATKYLDGTGAYSVPAGGGGGSSATSNSFVIPMGAWITANESSPATITSITNVGDGLIFAHGSVNAAHCLFAMPLKWDGGSVELSFMGVTQGTNSQAGAGFTNVVWAWKAAALGDGDAVDNPTFSSFISVTNHLHINNNILRHAYTKQGAIGGTPTTTKTVLWSIERNGTDSGDTLTNTLALGEIRVFYNETSSQPSFPAPSL